MTAINWFLIYSDAYWVLAAAWTPHLRSAKKKNRTHSEGHCVWCAARPVYPIPRHTNARFHCLLWQESSSNHCAYNAENRLSKWSSAKEEDRRQRNENNKCYAKWLTHLLTPLNCIKIPRISGWWWYCTACGGDSSGSPIAATRDSCTHGALPHQKLFNILK